MKMKEKVTHKVAVHEVVLDGEGNMSLKYISNSCVAVNVDKGDTITMMDLFTRQGYAVVVFPPEPELVDEEEDNEDEF